MAYHVVESRQAKRHLNSFTRRDQKIIRDAAALYLSHEPSVDTPRRKKLRDNPLAGYELRVGDFRVFYDVSEEELVVTVVAVGVKVHNRLFVEGKEYFL